MSKDSGIVEIHGKQYQTVAYRVGKFREKYPAHSLTTEIVHRDSELVVMKATIADENNRILATGHSEEVRKSTQINRTSALENAETSAIGRALAALGLGGTEFASADEVANAIGQQKASVKTVPQDDWEKLSVDEQTWLQDIVDQVRNELNQKGPVKALSLLEEQALEAHHKVAAWGRFDSKERASMKKAKEVANG